MSAIDDFLAHLAVEKQGSPHTLDAYRRDLDALARWAEGRDLATLEEADIRAFVAAEHRRGLAPKSLQRRLSACRSLYRWLLRHARIARDPCAGVRAPKAARRLPQVLDVDEAVQLVALLSVGIGILNLLPIPPLDGGHLVFYAAEAVMRRPLSERVMEALYRTGMFLVLAFMVFVFWNDLFGC